ncbi:MAG: PAS domain S-box protein [Candidatus Tectomicrobia bacterium]|nr:PAS domain S-box protein [Candidatus Tectomicrobia bacterium]
MQAARPSEDYLEVPGAARRTWLLISSVLAAFTLATVVMSLIFSHHLMQRYHQAVAVNQAWTQRLERYGELGQLAARVNAPVHAAFTSPNVEIEAVRMHMFLRLFNTSMAALRQEVGTRVPTAWVAPLLEDLTMVRDTVTEMASETDLIYADLRQHQPLKAYQRLARVNRLYADATAAFEALREDVRVVQQTLFLEQTTAVMALKRYEYLVAGGLLLMVGGVIVYGHAVARRIAREAWEKERYHAGLRDAEARTRAIIDTAVEGIITIDAQGRVETFNPAAERIFGYGIDEVVGQNVAMLMPSPYREEHDAYLARYLRTGEAKIIGIGREAVGQRKNGTMFPVDLAVSAVHVGGQQLFTGMVRDITARKRAEEVRQVRDHFAKFVPESVKRLVAANPEAPELNKQERDVSVLFLDISGYSRLSERLPPEVLNTLVERYFSAFLDCMQEAGGDINETAGDGFMAIFQDTDPQRHARTAVDTALALLTTTHMLNADNLEQPLAVHMGLNSGAALVGSTRFEGHYGTRWTFTASGPVTNLAARLAGIAEPGQILVGPETVRRLGDRYRLQPLGREHLKNLTEAVDVYRILEPSV